MIDFGADLKIAAATAVLLDFGGVLRPATGAALQKVERLGSRYRIDVTLPVTQTREGREIISDLIAAKREGGRIFFPLQYEDQGYPGDPVVNGANQTGLTLALRGLTPHHAVKKGYWLSIEDADGQHYLHNVRAHAVASSTGLITLGIEPMLRVPFANGAKVHLARPQVEGLIDGDSQSWSYALGGLVDSISFSIEEAA